VFRFCNKTKKNLTTGEAEVPFIEGGWLCPTYVFWAPLLAVLACIFLATAIASACECMGIDEELVPCAGCPHDFYTLQFCGGDGCIYGEECYISGYGECCQSKYETWNIYTNDCDPLHVCDECGDARIHASSHARGPTRVRSGTEAFVREATLTPNRCTGVYSPAYAASASSEKSAISDKAGVLRKGGL